MILSSGNNLLTRMQKRGQGLTVREVDGEVVVLDTESDQIHQLNRTASFIWRNCAEVTSANELAILLATEFDVEEHIALKDVIETLSTLRALRLIV